MKVSIITVCYNSASTVEKTILSVKNQTYTNIEHLIIDGFSTDGTCSIIEEHLTPKIKFISEKDSGLYDAMNKGILMASGDLVGILNSDDIFFNDEVVADIVNFHQKNIIDASIGDIVQFNESGKKVRTYSSKNWNPNKLKFGFMPPHPSIFFSTELFKRYKNYHLDFRSGADYELIVRFFLKNKIKWKYSNVTTTKMLLGGISSSGLKSYLMIFNEICIALSRNKIQYSKTIILFRGIWKIFGFINK